MATFNKRFVCLLIYRQTISLPVGPLCLWTLPSGGSGGRAPVINNFTTDQLIFTIELSSWKELEKEPTAGVAKFCVVVRSVRIHRLCYNLFCNIVFSICIVLFVDCLLYCILLLH